MAIIKSLKDVDEKVLSLEIKIDKSNVSAKVNDKEIKIIKIFVEDIIRNTIHGLCSTLKGVDGSIDEVFINVDL